MALRNRTRHMDGYPDTERSITKYMKRKINVFRKDLTIAVLVSCLCAWNLNAMEDLGPLVELLKTSPETATLKAHMLADGYAKALCEGNINKEQLDRELNQELNIFQEFHQMVMVSFPRRKDDKTIHQLRLLLIRQAIVKRIDKAFSSLEKEMEASGFVIKVAHQITEEWRTEHRDEFNTVNVPQKIKNQLQAIKSNWKNDWHKKINIEK